MGRQPRGRPAVLRARGTSAGPPEACRDRARRGRSGGSVPPGGMGQQPAEQGRRADTGAGGAAVQGRDAVVVMGVIVTAAAAFAADYLLGRQELLGMR